MSVSVIVPNYNGREIIPKCLRSLQQMSLRADEVIVVDNGSTDGSPDIISKDFPEVRLIELGENTGFTGANNAGCRASTGDVLVLLNNDCIVEKGWLEALLSRIEKDDVGAVASSMRNIADIDIMDSAGGAIDWMGFTSDLGGGEKALLHQNMTELPFACGGAMAVRREALPYPDRLFWEELFIYQEDVDLGLQLNRTGWKVVYEPQAVVRHEHSATMKKVNHFKEHLLTRNRLMVMRKHFRKDGFDLISGAVKRWHHLWIALSLLKGRFRLARSLMTGTSEGLRAEVPDFTADVSIFDIYSRHAEDVHSGNPIKRAIAASVKRTIKEQVEVAGKS